MREEATLPSGSREAEEPARPSDLPVDRRDFPRRCALAAPIVLGVVRAPAGLLGQETGELAELETLYAMGVDPQKCIGCARCAVACEIENDVPQEPSFFNT